MHNNSEQRYGQLVLSFGFGAVGWACRSGDLEEMGRSDRVSAFEGHVPAGLARATALSVVTAQRNRFEGTVPDFISTLRVLVWN